MPIAANRCMAEVPMQKLSLSAGGCDQQQGDGDGVERCDVRVSGGHRHRVSDGGDRLRQSDKDMDRYSNRSDNESRRIRAMYRYRAAAAAAGAPVDTDCDNWTDTLTAVTSETGFSGVSLVQPFNPSGPVSGSRKDLNQSIGFRCAHYVGVLVAGLLIIIAVVSPIIMVVLPKVGLYGWKAGDCVPECEGLLISLAVKLVVLLIGTWCLFIRRPASTLPRIDWYRAIVLLFVFLLLTAYWLFYAVRIVAAQESDYLGLVSFALSLVDTLLFVHYLAVILLYIIQLQQQYVVKIIRSPDGIVKSYTVGQYSIQSLVSWCLTQYYNDFPAYNPYLESRMSHRSSRTAHFKVYSVDGASDSEPGAGAVSSRLLGRGGSDSEGGRGAGHDGSVAGSSRVSGSRGGAGASGRVMGAGHNQRFYEEQEYERRLRKRRTRLIVATEEAFSHVRRMQIDKDGTNVQLDPRETAHTIFPFLARPLKKFLHVTRQQPQHTVDSIIDQLTDAVSNELSAKAFLSHFTSPQTYPLVWVDAEYNSTQTWNVICDRLLNSPASDGTEIRVEQGAVSLLVSVRKIPHISLLEDQPLSPISNKFVLRMDNDTAV